MPSLLIEVAAGLDTEDSFQKLLGHVADATDFSDRQWADKVQDHILVRRKLKLAVRLVLIRADLNCKNIYKLVGQMETNKKSQTNFGIGWVKVGF